MATDLLLSPVYYALKFLVLGVIAEVLHVAETVPEKSLCEPLMEMSRYPSSMNRPRLLMVL